MTETSRRKLSFKIGFFSKLAKEGVRPSAFFEHVKSAAPGDPLSGLLSAGYGEAKGLAGLVGSNIVPAAKLLATVGTLAPIGIGATTGTLAAKLNAPPEPDIEAIRKQELIELYRRLTTEIRAKRRIGSEV